MKTVICKEVYVRGQWEHIGHIYTPEPVISELFNRHGNAVSRQYSLITKLLVDFHRPDDYVKTINHNKLQFLRTLYGHAEFDRLIGCFPFDHIDSFQDQETINMLQNIGISAARIVSFRI